MKVDHRLAEQEFSLAEERLRGVGLNRVYSRLIGRNVVEIDAQVNLLTLVVNLTGSGGDHSLAVERERGLRAVGEKDSVRILDAEIDSHRSLRSQVVLDKAQGGQKSHYPAATVRNLVGSVVGGDAQASGLDHGTGGHLTGKVLDLSLEVSVLRTVLRGAAAASAVSLWFNVLSESICTM